MRDHEEIARLLAELQGEAQPRPSMFERLRELLEGHMQWEERELFPALERGDPLFGSGPGRALRMDHEAIRRFLGIAAKHARRGSPSRLREVLAQLEGVLRQHDRTEAAYLR